MGRDLLARGLVDATAEDGTVDGEDFHEGLTVGTGDEEHLLGLYF